MTGFRLRVAVGLSLAMGIGHGILATTVYAQDYDYPQAASPAPAPAPVQQAAPAAKAPPLENGYYDRFGLPRAGTVKANGVVVTTAPPPMKQRNFGVSIPNPPRAAGDGSATGTSLRSGSAFRGEESFQNDVAKEHGDPVPFPHPTQ